MKKKYSFLLIFLLVTTQAFAEEGLRDIKSPLSIPFSGYWLIAAVVLLLFLIGFVIRWLIKRPKKAKIEKKIILPPWVIANQRLVVLLDKNLHGQGRFNDFFSQLSDIIRRYIEARFIINAPEMTTPEFLDYINRDNKLRLEQKQVLREFLDCCDRVKFAKYGPSNKEVDQSIDVAKRFIEETTLKEELKRD